MNEAVLASGVIGLCLAVFLVKLSAVERRLDRLSRLEAKIDALLSAGGIEFDAFRDVPPDVREALERGETILAIKRLRHATGVGLKEAKEFVDELRRRRRITAG
jgi:hypothetical protein